VSAAAREIGPYRLLRLLGTGGMGEVWLAERVGEGGFRRRCCVKTMLPQLARRPGVAELFAREARLAARVTHDHVVQVFDFGRADDDTLYLAMAWVDGTSLRELLGDAAARGEVLEVGDVCALFADAARGLAAVHELKDDDGTPLGLVHRDATPDNILVTREGLALLGDFGIALTREGERLTETGELRGKAALYVPRAARRWRRQQRQRRLHPRRRPLPAARRCAAFDRATELATMNAIVRDPTPQLTTLRPVCPTASSTSSSACSTRTRPGAPRPPPSPPCCSRSPAPRSGPRPRRPRPRRPTRRDATRVDEPTAANAPTAGTDASTAASGPDGTTAGDTGHRHRHRGGDVVVGENARRRRRAVAGRRRRRRAVADQRGHGHDEDDDDSDDDSDDATRHRPDRARPPPSPPPPTTTTPPAAPTTPAPSPPPAPTTPSPVTSPPATTTTPTAGSTVTLRGGPGIRWSTSAGRVLGTGTLTTSLAGRSVVALDTATGGRSVVPVVAGVADVDRLPVGRLDVRAHPWADVFVGDRRLGTTPLRPLPELRVGRYRVRLVKDDVVRTVDVEVKAGEATAVRADLTTP
jgi:eukaryotic-like serine/threonine-protein kinase